MQLPAPGDVFEGRFRIESTLGEGGFGAVFLAHDEADRPVALKVLKPDLRDGYAHETRARFEREVQIIGSLRSPHTVRLFNHGESAAGLLYMVFEYVPGQDLSRYLEAVHRLDPKWVVHIMRQVLLSLDEAHKAGLIHRDLKPENIRLFEYQGDAMTVKLLDFGIARGTDDGHPSITKTGELVGTPRYMSPEQLTARPLGPSSDIYSLGMVAFELLVGPDGLPGTSLADQFGRLRSGHVFSIPEIERIGAPLLQVIQKMTAREPDARYPSAAAVLAVLDRGELHRSAKSTRPEPGQPLPRQPSEPPERHPSGPVSPAPVAATTSASTRKRVLIATAGVLLVAIVAAIGFANSADDVDPVTPAVETRAVGGILRQQQPKSKPPRPEPRTVAEDVGAPAVFDQGADLTDATAHEVGPPPDDAVASDGCGKPAKGGVTVTEDGDVIYLPRDYDPGRPHAVMLVLRMDRQNARELFALSGLDRVADRERFVVIVPEDRTPDGMFDKKAWRDKPDRNDVVSTLDEYADNLCLDRVRLFVVSFGEGHRIGLHLACEPWVAGLASHSFSYHTDMSRDICAPRKLPVMWLAPRHTPQLPIEGGRRCDKPGARAVMSIHQAEQVWIGRNGCDADSLTSEKFKVATCRTWTCDAAFKSCEIDGGMGWPGSQLPAGMAPLCGDEPRAAPFPLAAQLWRFFAAAPPAPEPF